MITSYINSKSEQIEYHSTSLGIYISIDIINVTKGTTISYLQKSTTGYSIDFYLQHLRLRVEVYLLGLDLIQNNKNSNIPIKAGKSSLNRKDLVIIEGYRDIVDTKLSKLFKDKGINNEEAIVIINRLIQCY